MVAGERFSGRRRERVRLPTGSPVSTYCSTISRNTAAERASRPGGKGGVRRPCGGTLEFITRTPAVKRKKHGPGGQTKSGGIGSLRDWRAPIGKSAQGPNHTARTGPG